MLLVLTVRSAIASGSARISRASIVLWAALACACGEATGAPVAPNDAGVAEDGAESSVVDSAALDAEEDAVDSDLGLDTGMLGACTSAVEITEGELTAGAVDPVTAEAEFYLYEIAAGKIVLFDLAATSMSQSLTDPVITLWSQDGSTLLATDDDTSAVFLPDGYPEIDQSHDWLRCRGMASRLAYRSPVDEVVCIRVEERSTWMNVDPGPIPQLEYWLRVTTVDQTNACLDVEPNDTVASAQPTEPCQDSTSASATRLLRIAGVLESEADLDVFRIPVPEDTGLIDLRFDASGPGGPGQEGNGSSVALGRLELTDAAGAVYARANTALGVRELYAHVPTGQDVFLKVPRRPSSIAGENDFYFLGGGVTWPDLLDRYGETEQAAGGNDTPETAETTSSIHDAIFGYLEWVVTGFIHETAPGDPIDVDYWSFEAFSGGPVALRCWSARIGSGVVHPTFAVLDAQHTVVRSAVETPDQDLAWREGPSASAPPLVIADGGLHYLRVSADGQDPEVSSRVYVCGIDVFVP